MIPLLIFISCDDTATSVEENEDSITDDISIPDITSYSNPDMDGNWRINGSYNQYYYHIDGNDVSLCEVDEDGFGEQVNAHLGPENFIYPSYDDTTWVPYSFDGTNFSTFLGNPSDQWFDQYDSDYVDYFKDSDYNPCVGNTLDSTFMFQFGVTHTVPYKYAVYVNDELLFDKDSIDEYSCGYAITPSSDYTIDVRVEYTYCPHYECAFSPEDFQTATYSETIKLKHLRNDRCNKLAMDGYGSGSRSLYVYQDLR